MPEEDRFGKKIRVPLGEKGNPKIIRHILRKSHAYDFKKGK